MYSRVTARSLHRALGGWRTRDPAYEALADAIRLLCLDNRLAPRTALPAERELAATLGLSRTTVAAAYRSLRESGHIESLRGSGSVTLPAPHRESAPPAHVADEIDLTQASPAAWPGLAGALTETASEAASILSRPGYDIVGSRELRRAIAARYEQRGLPTRPEEILVTTGAQSAIHLIASALVRRGDRVVIETPTYPHAAEAFRNVDARLVTIPVSTSGGWDLERAEQVFSRTEPTLAYLMPTFHNPTGRSMTRREQDVIARAAGDSGCMLVLDETTAELSLDDATIPDPALIGTPALRIGSLGKTVWGGLRVGWIRAQPQTIRRLVASRPSRELGTPEFEQAVAVGLLQRMPEILSQRAALLAEGHTALRETLATRLPEWGIPDVQGGVSLWVRLDAPLSAGLVMALRTRGVHLSSGSRFAPDGTHESNLRIPFTASPQLLRRGVGVIADVWPAVKAAAPRGLPEDLATIV